MKIYILLLALLHTLACGANEITCVDKYYNSANILKLKELLLSKNENLSKGEIVYPFHVQIAGAIDDYPKYLLDVRWNDVFTQKARNSLKKASPCELVKYLGIKEVNGHYKATQLVFNFDKEDLKYSHSSISSAKELRAFIIKMNRLAKQSPKKLGDYIYYPFGIPRNGKILTINNKEDFIKNVAVIVNNEFIKGIRGQAHFTIYSLNLYHSCYAFSLRKSI